MARQLRIEFPGALYHVTSRGNARQTIFADDGDRIAFLDIVAGVVARANWLCHAYCLMDNHYHLMVETPDGNLSRGMRQLNGVYTQHVNRRHRRVGHLFQGRYKAILVDREGYLLELSRYIVLNPVRAGRARQPGDHRWSSYRATAGLATPRQFLTTDWILSQFGPDRGQAQAGYRAFVTAGRGVPPPWDGLKGQVILGGKGFVEALKPRLARAAALAEVPRVQRHAGRPSLATLLGEVTNLPKAQRDRRIAEAHAAHGYAQSEIARHLGLHSSTVSKIVKTAEKGSEKGSGLEL